MNRSILRVSNLSYAFSDRQVLEDVSFELRIGVTGLVGVNGAGKTTLLHILATVLRRQSGTIAVQARDGQERGDRVGLQREIALAPQSLTLPENLTVTEFLHYLAWMRALPRSDRSAEVARVLELVDLGDQRSQRAGSLSGGMMRRLNLAQALLGAPRVVLLDEPMDDLDPEQRIRLRSTIRAVACEAAVLVSSHAMDDLAPITDRILMLDRHKLVFDDTPDSLAALGTTVLAPDAGVSAYEAGFLALREVRS